MSGMSRYIWCLGCLEELRPENEPDTLRLGKVAQLGVSCDRCGELVPIGVEAAAASYHDEPEAYWPWEHEFFATLDEHERRRDERPSRSPGEGDTDGRSGESTQAKHRSHNWPIISMYTRSQAIADGVLVDVTSTAHKVGFHYPVALTCGVWAECVATPPHIAYLDEGGRLWRVLTLLASSARANGRKPFSETRYRFRIRNDYGDEKPPPVELVAVCERGDDGGPCVTVMLPGED